jgi:predicted choloylglycine hydrolase
MTSMALTFDAVSEEKPGPKWAARWRRSWPAYEAWFVAGRGDSGPSRRESRAALLQYMPELVPTYDRLVDLAGGSDRAARFLATWCPPRYLGGCSLAARAGGGEVRLVRNYDLSPDLNEGLLLHTGWTGRKVMGMIEFLWGLSDGINDAGLSVALAYGGRPETADGFGVTTILRYVLETCETVDEALKALRRVPSHMAYNLVLADRSGRTAGVELSPGDGIRLLPEAIATNHQSGPAVATRANFTRTHERLAHLGALRVPPRSLAGCFLAEPLLQDRYAEGFGTLFTAEYDPAAGSMQLHWRDEAWKQSLDMFEEGQRVIRYPAAICLSEPRTASDPARETPDWRRAGQIDWIAVATEYARGRGRPIESYLPAPAGALRLACTAGTGRVCP